MTYTNVLLTVLTVCAVCGSAGVILVLLRLSSTLQHVERLIGRLELSAPQLDRLLVDAQQSLDAAEELTDRIRDIADDAKAVSSVTRHALVPAIHRLSDTGSVAAQGLSHVAAFVAATKAGISALSRNGH